jgi:hypothetical protein
MNLQVLGEKLNMVAELKPEHFDIIRGEFNLENQFSDELQELPVFNSPKKCKNPKNDDAHHYFLSSNIISFRDQDYKFLKEITPEG